MIRWISILTMLVLGSLACSPPIASPTAKPTSQPAKVMFTMPSVPIPNTLEGMPAYLERFLPPEAKGNVEIIPPASISVMFTTSEDFMPEVNARKYAREFVFAAYGSGLALDTVQIVVTGRDGRVGLSVTVDGNDAATQPASVWRDTTIGPTIFIDWLREKSVSGKSRLGGPWSN